MITMIATAALAAAQPAAPAPMNHGQMDHGQMQAMHADHAAAMKDCCCKDMGADHGHDAQPAAKGASGE